jgi:hypothetical protein
VFDPQHKREKKKKANSKPDMVSYTCNPTTWEGEAGSSSVLSQPGLQNKQKQIACYQLLLDIENS